MSHPSDHAAELERSESLLDERIDGIDLDVNLESPMNQRQLAPWDIRTEYDLMAWGFRVAALRHRAAIAAEMAKAIARQAESEERRLVYAVGGRVLREGEKQRTDYGLVQDYVRAHLARGKKSLKTPAGTFSFRAAPALCHVPGGAEQELLAWCKEHAPGWVKTETTESVDMEALKAHIEETGEVPANANGEQLVVYLRAGRFDFFNFKPAEGAEALPAAAPDASRLEGSSET